MSNETEKTPEETQKPKGVKPYVVGKRALFEGGDKYESGAEIYLKPARAKALGKLVKPAE